MRRFVLSVTVSALTFMLWGLPSAATAQNTGFVEIRRLTSSPNPGLAQVFVDGALWPEPLDDLANLLLELAPGRHALRVTRAGSQPFAQEVRVAAGEVVILDALLPPATTQARLIHLLPADAPYLIEGLRIEGTTPATLDVPVGEHVFVVDGKRFCFGLVPDSAAYIRIRSGVIDELRGVTECPALPPLPVPYDAARSEEGINVRMEGLRRDYPEYWVNIIRQIQRCFRPPSGNWVASVTFVIRRDGSVVDDLAFESRSGNTSFDYAAMSAIECAGQGGFGPLPEDLPYEAQPIRFEFRPSGGE